MEKVAYVMYK